MSFSDMMSSGRGPGVVGMLMALLVLIGFGFLFVFSFDKEMQGGGKSIGSIVADQKKEIETVKRWIGNGEARLEAGTELAAFARELAEYSRENTIRTGTIEGLTSAFEEIKSGYEATAEEFSQYKDSYREFARSNAKGEKIGELVTVSGEVYKEVEIREVTAVGMQIRHQDGQKRIAFEDLPEALKDRFQFDADQKEAALAKELVAHREHADAVASALSGAEQEREAQQEIRMRESREKKIADLTKMKNRASDLNDEIRELTKELRLARSEREAARGTGRTFVDRSKGIQQQLTARQNQLARLRGMITSLESQL